MDHTYMLIEMDKVAMGVTVKISFASIDNSVYSNRKEFDSEDFVLEEHIISF